jgi:hypothetical protein
VLVVCRKAGGEFSKKTFESQGVRPGRFKEILKTPQFGRGDHFHSAGDFFCILDAPNAPSDLT